MRIFNAVLLLCLVGTAALAAPPTWQVPRTKDAPVIDGDLSDACWKDQTLVNNFCNPKTGEPVTVQTYFRVLYDDDSLYFAISCPEPDMKALRTQFTDRDDTLWSDDCVELMLDPTNRRQSYAHIIVNPNGTVYDAWMLQAGASTDMDFDAGVEAAAKRLDDSWQAEIRVPFAGLRLPTDVKPDWGFNLCRERKTDPAEALSCWAPPLSESFNKPEAFGTLSGIAANFRPHMISLGLPQFREPFFEAGALNGKLLIPYTNFSGRDVAVRVKAIVTDLDQKTTQVEVNAGLRGGRANLLIPVVAPSAGFGDLQLEVWRRQPPKLLHRTRVGLQLDYQPVQITFLQPAYRDTIYASLPNREIICHLKVNLPRQQYAGSELRATFLNGATALAVQRIARVPGNGEVEVAFSSEIVPAGEYLVRAQAIKAGNVIAEGERKIRKVRPQEQEVVIGRDGKLLVNGKPFFPCGFMGATPDQAIAKAGFNLIHTYNAWYVHRDQDLNAWLNQAMRLGLKVILSPFPGEVSFYGFRGKALVGEEELREIRAFVETYRRHPAVLAWYMCDEPRGAVWKASLERVYKTVADADPYHPCVALDNSVSTLLKLQNVGDILWIDPYPGFSRKDGPKEPMTLVAQALQDIRAGQLSNRPIWIAPQAFSYSEWDKSRESTERAPTLTEARFMHYLALLNRADGIIPFAWAYTLKQPSLLVAYTDIIGPEMSLLMPALLEGKGTEGCRVTALSQGADVQVGAWSLSGDHYIVVVNRKAQEARIRIFVPGIGNGMFKVVSENRRFEAFQNAIEDTLPPWGVRIYCDKKKLPSVLPLDQAERRIRYEEEAKKAAW